MAALISSMVSNAAASSWRDTWQELAGDCQEFALPLRLLNAAVRYRETYDQRLLLELPVEEYKPLESCLAMSEPPKP